MWFVQQEDYNGHSPCFFLQNRINIKHLCGFPCGLLDDKVKAYIVSRGSTARTGKATKHRVAIIKVTDLAVVLLMIPLTVKWHQIGTNMNIYGIFPPKIEILEKRKA